MSKENTPILPPRFNEALKNDQTDLARREEFQDCLPCRLMGSGAFIGLGVYTFWSGQNQLRQQQNKILRSQSRLGLRGRFVAITGMSVGLVGLGLYRLVN